MKKILKKAAFITEEVIMHVLVALQAAFYTSGAVAFYHVSVYFNHATIVCK